MVMQHIAAVILSVAKDPMALQTAIKTNARESGPPTSDWQREPAHSSGFVSNLELLLMAGGDEILRCAQDDRNCVTSLSMNAASSGLAAGLPARWPQTEGISASLADLRWGSSARLSS